MKRHASHWLMIQTFRQGVSLSVNSAWLVFPDQVNLSEAAKPIDVLRSFVKAYGVPFKLNGEEHLFIESIPAQSMKDNRVELPKGELFYSISFRNIANEMGVMGAVYCIDVRRYRESILNSGVNIKR
jgi:hypothetical protein